MFGEIAPRLHGGAPRPMRYVTGPSPAISNCCHHLFIFAFPSRFTPPFILLPVRLPTATAGPGLINVSESRRGRGGDTVAANRFRAGAHCCKYNVVPRLVSTTMPHYEGRYLLTCVARSGEKGLSCEARRVVTVWMNTNCASSAAPEGSC